MSTEFPGKLIKAIWDEDIRGVEALLNSGGDVNAVGSKGMTPLMHAAELEHLAIARLLLERGPDVNRAGYHG